MQDNSRDLYECVVISSHAVVVDDYDDVARPVACSFISSSSSSTSSLIHQIIRLSVATVPMFDHDQAACYDLTLIFQSFQRTPKMVPQRPRSRAAQLRPPQPGLRATISRIWSKSVHRPSISLSSAKTVNSGNVSATAPRASPRWPLPSTMSQKR